MKASWCPFALVIVLCLVAAPSAAQNGTVTVYFDPDWTQRTMDCPGSGIGNLYVVAEDFDTYLMGVEFKIEYPPCMTWLADLDAPPATIGSSPQGVSMGFPMPKNGYEPVLVMRALVMWNCADCSALNQHVCVVPHPLFGYVRAVRFPDYEIIDGRGRESVVCQHVDLDIKPGSCPNPFNVKFFDFAEGSKPNKGGVLPVAVLGSETFDVTHVDLSSLRLEGVMPLTKGGPMIADAAGPVMDGDECACTTTGPDGYPDIMMRFQSQEIAAAIAPGYEGDRTLTLTGTYLDGVPFEATDCIRIMSHGPMPMQYSDAPELIGAYPNPFNPATRLMYFVPQSQYVSLCVYDVAGRLVTRLVDGVVDAGEHTIEWNAEGLSSGIYFGRLHAGETTQVKRLVVLK